MLKAKKFVPVLLIALTAILAFPGCAKVGEKPKDEGKQIQLPCHYYCAPPKKGKDVKVEVIKSPFEGKKAKEVEKTENPFEKDMKVEKKDVDVGEIEKSQE